MEDPTDDSNARALTVIRTVAVLLSGESGRAANNDSLSLGGEIGAVCSLHVPMSGLFRLLQSRNKGMRRVLIGSSRRCI